jgi:hypothetical protein
MLKMKSPKLHVPRRWLWLADDISTDVIVQVVQGAEMKYIDETITLQQKVNLDIAMLPFLRS